jgi:protein tyrosine phosphatase (PTP) superfamily phosphohydrolase (DUF442 family)
MGIKRTRARGHKPISFVLPIVVLALVGCGAERAEPTSGGGAGQVTASNPPASPHLLPGGPTEADYPRLHNLLQVAEQVYSGAEPKEEEAFRELSRLGIKTIVSVDGARPRIDLAEKYGLRYVHIPIGYDGVSDAAALQFASVAQTAEGPFYVHCHHGKHRGPAAAAVICVAAGVADGESALEILRRAGTSSGYAGLWRDVQRYAPPASKVELPELVSVAEVGSMAAAMAQIDRASDNLKLCQTAEWRTPDGHPDVSPSQEALLLKEGFRETVRQLEAENPVDDQFVVWMKQSEETANQLQAALERQDASAAARLFQSIQDQCQRCHQEHRN